MKNTEKKIGVMLVNLGTPDAPSRGAVYRYLKQFLLDGRVIDYSWLPRNLLVRGIIAPFRSGSSAKLYQRLWTDKGSPIKYHGIKVAEEVDKLLPENYLVELAMRYQNPSMESALKKLLDKHIDELVVFPMFPQYASATTGSIHEEIMRLLKTEQAIPSLKLINAYPTDARIIEIFCNNARKYDLSEYDHFLFSYHGLPQRQLKKGDRSALHCLKVDNCCTTLCNENKFCYSAHCHQTSYAIAEKLEIENYTVCFQSRLGPEAWAQPYTSQTIEEKLEAGNKKILVFSPAFVADCLETTIEIGYEYKQEFIDKGGVKLDLVESLNDHPDWITAISEMVQE